MFLLIFLSLTPECSLNLHWVLNLPFFFFFLLLKQILEEGYYCKVKGKDGYPKLGKLYFRV